MLHILAVDHCEEDRIKKKRVYLICLIVLSICSAVIWINVAVKSAEFDKKIEHMVFGKDYFIEDVTIVNKKIFYGNSTAMGVSSDTYFFYYGNDEHEKMEVPYDTYLQYAVGDKIQAYTVDHVSYGYEKESILPAKEHKCNEFMKFIGVLTGCCMILVALFYLLSR